MVLHLLSAPGNFSSTVFIIISNPDSAVSFPICSLCSVLKTYIKQQKVSGLCLFFLVAYHLCNTMYVHKYVNIYLHKCVK